jgi:hypothetical protein
MPRGSTQPLLSCRSITEAHSSGLGGWAGALDPEQCAQISAVKRVIYDGDGRIAREAAVAEITWRYRQWVDVFKRAKAAAGAPEGAFATARATLPQG